MVVTCDRSMMSLLALEKIKTRWGILFNVYLLLDRGKQSQTIKLAHSQSSKHEEESQQLTHSQSSKYEEKENKFFLCSLERISH